MDQGGLTRGQAAKALRTSLGSVRRLEASGVLPSTVDAKGVHRFAPEDVQRVASSRAKSTPSPHDDARARRVVQLTPDEVEQLVALGCGDDRGELTGRSLVLTVARLRERLRHLRSRSTTTTATHVTETPRRESASASASSTSLDTFPSNSRPANDTAAAYTSGDSDTETRGR